jgi:hypothetical protein
MKRARIPPFVKGAGGFEASKPHAALYDYHAWSIPGTRILFVEGQ